VAQGVGPEFKPQYHKTNKKNIPTKNKFQQRTVTGAMVGAGDSITNTKTRVPGTFIL
jgi:hypothetical protein